MAHYPSDGLVALFIGVFSGFVAAAITQLIFRFLESRRDESAVCNFLLDEGIGSGNIKGILRRENKSAETASLSTELPPDIEVNDPRTNRKEQKMSSRTSEKAGKKTGAYIPKH